MDTPRKVRSGASDAPTVTSQLPPRADTVGSDDHPEDTINVDSVMNTAFGDSIIQWETNNTDNDWYNRWLSVAHMSGKLYSLPGGSVGRKYVEHLSQDKKCPIFLLGIIPQIVSLFFPQFCYKEIAWCTRGLISEELLRANYLCSVTRILTCLFRRPSIAISHSSTTINMTTIIPISSQFLQNWCCRGKSRWRSGGYWSIPGTKFSNPLNVSKFNVQQMVSQLKYLLLIFCACMKHPDPKSLLLQLS